MSPPAAAPPPRARVSPDWRYIHTHFGIGYRFAAEPAVAALGSAEPEAVLIN